MPDIKRNIFREDVRNEVWGTDWTSMFNPNDLLPGTVLLDPRKNADLLLHSGDFAPVLQRSPLVLDHKDYVEVTTALKLDDKLATGYAIGAFEAHNEGTKFGSRRVMVATPILMDGERFDGHEDLMPYFLLEQELELSALMPRLYRAERGEKLNTPQMIQDAKKGVMESALYNGKLQQYLELHDKLYPPTSKDPSLWRQFEMRRLAEADVIAKYTTFLSMVSNGVRRLAGRGSSEPYADLRGVQKQRQFTPADLKQVVYQR